MMQSSENIAWLKQENEHILIVDACLQLYHGLEIKSICYYMGAASKRFQKCINNCKSTMKRLLETKAILPHNCMIFCVRA